MNKDYSLYEKPFLPDQNFPMRIEYTYVTTPAPIFKVHWHEDIELLYFTEGHATVRCNSSFIDVLPGDLVIANSNEIHYIQSHEIPLGYYCLIVDPVLLSSNAADSCQTKYITPISQNLIVFTNRVCNDPEVSCCLKQLILEYDRKDMGYELSIKSIIYRLLVHLLRNHTDVILTPKEYDQRNRNHHRLNKVIGYIEENYMQKLTVEALASYSNLSEFHFSRLFKKATGKSPVDYINHLRISKAEQLLKTTDMTVTEVAMFTGFNDINYFSRMYRNRKNAAPSSIRKG